MFPAVLIEVRCSVLHPRVLGHREQLGAQLLWELILRVAAAHQESRQCLPERMSRTAFFPWISTALPYPPPRPPPSPRSVCPQQPVGQGSEAEPRVPRPRVVFTLRDVDVLAVIPAPRRAPGLARTAPSSGWPRLWCTLPTPQPRVGARATLCSCRRRPCPAPWPGAHAGGGWRGWGCRPCAGASLATKDHEPPLLHSRQSMYRACSFHIAENLRAFFYFWSLYIMDLNNKERF